MSYKVFVNGDTLQASELNTYLMKQAVMVFPSAGSRDASLTAPTEGMFVYLEDANDFFFYTGSGWASFTGGWADVSANYAITANDKNAVIRSTAGAITVTVNNVLVKQGDKIDFIQAGTGQITFVAGSGVTLNSASSANKTNKQFAGASIIFGGAGVYYLVGNIV